MKDVIIITGASSGFGALVARALARAVHTVYASMRETAGRNAPQVAEAQKYAAKHNVDLRTIDLDVASEASADAAIEAIVTAHGRLDVVIHNAGHMVFGPAEAFTPEQFAELYDVNVLSTQRVNRAALPQLRRQGQGLVIWVSSSSSAGGTPPYLAPYFAAKAALGRPPTRHGLLNTTPAPMRVSRTRCSKGPSRWSMPSRTVSAPSFFVGLASATCWHRERSSVEFVPRRPTLRHKSRSCDGTAAAHKGRRGRFVDAHGHGLWSWMLPPSRVPPA